jgi:hypothetical protein
VSAVKITVKKPKWSVGELVDWELREYRERLETALASLPAGSADYAEHDGRLKEVIAEQEARSVTTGIPAGPWTES